MCQICDAVDFQGFPGVRKPGKNLRIATRLRELLSCSEFRNGTWVVPLTFKIGRSRNQVSSRCSRAPFNERPWWRYAMNSVETSDLQCLPFIQFSYRIIFISPCFLWWIHAYTDLVSRTDTIMTVLYWLHHIMLWWLINIDYIFFRTLTICVIRDNNVFLGF